MDARDEAESEAVYRCMIRSSHDAGASSAGNCRKRKAWSDMRSDRMCGWLADLMSLVDQLSTLHHATFHLTNSITISLPRSIRRSEKKHVSCTLTPDPERTLHPEK